MAPTRFLCSTSILLLSLLVIASASDYGYVPKPDYGKPKPEGNDQSQPTKTEYDQKPNSEGKDELLPSLIGIQGLVLCKSGSEYVPLQGAVAKITCIAIDENGYETVPFSILSDECDAKGYFLSTLSSSFLKDNWKIKECKAFLAHSPLGNCKVPSDVNHGITGALLSSFRVLSDKNMKLYSVGPFFYTSEPDQSLPNGY